MKAIFLGYSLTEGVSKASGKPYSVGRLTYGEEIISVSRKDLVKNGYGVEAKTIYVSPDMPFPTNLKLGDIIHIELKVGYQGQAEIQFIEAEL